MELLMVMALLSEVIESQMEDVGEWLGQSLQQY